MTETSSGHAGVASVALGESTVDSGIITLETASRLLLGRLPASHEDYAALGRRIGMSGRGLKYSGSYIKYVMIGKHPYSKPVEEGTITLISELNAEPPDREYHSKTVQVPNGFDVPDGTIIQRSARTCVCGVSFIPTAWNQINHTKACAKMRARMKKRR